MKSVIALIAVAGLTAAATAQSGFTLTSGTATYSTASFNNPYASWATNSSSAATALTVSGPSSRTSGTASIRHDTWGFRYTGQGLSTNVNTFASQGFGNGVTETASGGTGSWSRNGIGTSAGGLFNARFDFALTQPVANSALLQITLTITNPSTTSALGLRLFNSVDHQLLGTSTGDALNPTLQSFGSLVGIRSDDSAGASMYLIHYADNPGTYRGATPGNIYTTGSGAANSGNGGLHNNTINIPAATDAASGYSWDVTIAAGQSRSVTAYYSVNYTIPTPGAAALLGVAGMVATRRRRA
jgi:hypothetical protein